MYLSKLTHKGFIESRRRKEEFECLNCHLHFKTDKYERDRNALRTYCINCKKEITVIAYELISKDNKNWIKEELGKIIGVPFCVKHQEQITVNLIIAKKCKCLLPSKCIYFKRIVD